MTAPAQTDLEVPRTRTGNLKARLESGQHGDRPDAHAPKAWAASDQRIRGDLRVAPEHFQVEPFWPKDQLTVAYCT